MASKGAERRSTRGFTLLELLVAIALLGVLAVLCWRGLDSVLATRERLNRDGESLRAITVAFAQLDDDLRRTWAVRTMPAVPRTVRFMIINDQVVLELARLGGSASDPTRIDRVVWRLRESNLERGVAANTSAELVWQPVLSEVRSVQWRAWPSAQSWQTGEALALQADQADAAVAADRAADPPLVGVELTLERLDGGQFLRVFAVRD